MNNKLNLNVFGAIRILFRFLPCIAFNTLLYVGCISHNSQTASSTFVVDISKPGAAVAPILRGQQIEEFNHGFQGGLIAQMLNNPTFEELVDPIKFWSVAQTGSSGAIISAQTSANTQMLNRYQQHCIKMSISSVVSGPVGLSNGGYWGLGLRNNTLYKVSFWVRKRENFNGDLTVKLESNEGRVFASSDAIIPTKSWAKYTCDLRTSGIASPDGNNRFVIYASAPGDIYFDVVTLNPPTWNDQPNGLRPDLAQMFVDLKIKYIQYPGGCMAESKSMDECWNWKNSIGPLEERPGSYRTPYSYKNNQFFGVDEFFQLCEQLKAEPVYTCSCGISEFPGGFEAVTHGACPLNEMQPIIQDILDLLEYVRGDSLTTWGARRAANGHPAPYNLRYVQIGNENNFAQSDYDTHYPLVYSAIHAAYPDIEAIHNGTGVNGKMVDYVNETHFPKPEEAVSWYDRFNDRDPSGKRMVVAEFASTDNGNLGQKCIGNLHDALGDAVFALGCEKNSANMFWTGYGNYASLLEHNDFGPNIVWHDCLSCFGTPSYQMQKMLFTENQGSRVLPFIEDGPLFWSTSIDTESGKHDILVKVVNSNGRPEIVKITLKGAENVNKTGHSTTLTGAPDDENSIANPTKIVPVSSTFKASKSFNYTFPAYSVTVLRIRS
jgi:alpha-L-arabinofuranosidase